jgi:hypothetical protein
LVDCEGGHCWCDCDLGGEDGMRVLEFGVARARSLPKQARVSESSIEECTNRRPRLSFSATCSHGEGFFNVTFVDPYSGISNFSISKSALCRRETNMMARIKLRISRVKWWYQHLGCTLFNTPWHIRREDLGLHASYDGCLKDAAFAQSWVGSSH